MKHFHLIFLIIIFGLIGGSFAQNQQQPGNPKQVASYTLENPRQAISRHLYYLNNDEGQFNPALSADALSGENLTEKERIDLAIKLKQIYDAKGTEIKPTLIPDDPNFQDSTDGAYRYTVAPNEYPEFFVKKEGNVWRYAPESVAEIERVHKRVIPRISAMLQTALPHFTQNDFLGIKIWQYLGLLLISVLSYVIYRLTNGVLTFFIKRFGPRLTSETPLDFKLIRRVVRPSSLYLVTWLLRELFIPALILPIFASKYLILALEVVAPVLGVLIFYRLIDVLADFSNKLADKTSTAMDDQAIPLLTKAAKLIVSVFGVIFILQNLDVNVTALLAGVSIGGLALALAAQDTVKNFIGSLSIFIDRPFVIGDFIVTDSFSGVVMEVGVRSSRIRALDGAQITVPNGKLNDMVITNHGVRTYRRYATNLAITYDTAPDVIEKFVDGVRGIAKAHPMADPDSVTVQFHEMADSSLNLFFAVIYLTPDYGAWLKARQEVFLEIMKLAEELGVSFAFPSTSVYLENMPDKQANGES